MDSLNSVVKLDMFEYALFNGLYGHFLMVSVAGVDGRLLTLLGYGWTLM